LVRGTLFQNDDSEKMNILTANETDIEALTHVEIESKKHSIPDCIEDYEIDYSLRHDRWQTYFKGQSPQTSKPERLVLKAVNNDSKVIGYLAGHITIRYNLHAEIQSFYVLRQMQKQQTGTNLLTEFVKWLINMNAKSLCVGIRPENKYKAFYVKHGGQYLNEYWIYWENVTQLLENLIQSGQSFRTKNL
jgi:ribosomal protein S18 acetylase RimI-like enzyme